MLNFISNIENKLEFIAKLIFINSRFLKMCGSVGFIGRMRGREWLG